MGQSSSRRIAMFRARNEDIGPIDGALDSDTLEVRDRSDLVSVLQYLIRSGVVHIVPQSDDDSDTASSFKPTIPSYGSRYKPNTQIIDQSEIKLQTLQATDSLEYRGVKRSNSNNVASLILKRQRGIHGFSNGERCKINNTYLPNKVDKKLAMYDGKVFTGTFSKSGNTFLTASQDKFIRIYNTSSSNYELKSEVAGRDVGWSILDTAFSSDGKMFAYSSWSENVHVCNIGPDDSVNQVTLPFCPEGRRFGCFSLAFSHDSSEILGGANDGGLYVYDLDYKRRGLKIRGHGDDVNTVCFADESSHILYSGGDDGLCKVWDRRTLSESLPKPVGVLAGHRDGITHIDPKGDSRHLISNSKDQTIKLWDVRKFSSKTAQRNTCKAVNENGWDYRRENVPRPLTSVKKMLEGDTSVMTYRGHTVLQTLIRCRFSPAFSTGQRYIYTGCAAGRVVIYDILTGKIVTTLNGHKGCVRDVAWHPYRPEILSTSWDHSVLIWDYKKSDCPFTPANADEKLNEKLIASNRNSLRRSARIAAQRRARRNGDSDNDGEDDENEDEDEHNGSGNQNDIIEDEEISSNTSSDNENDNDQWR